MKSSRLLAVDFDGTIYNWSTNAPFPGCIEKLAELRKQYWIGIFSARKTDTERVQMKTFLDSEHVPYDEILERKPDAIRYIDDKGIQFDGDWSRIPTEFVEL